MFKSIFTKYIAFITLLMAFSIALLVLTISTMLASYSADSKSDLMTKTADSVAVATEAYFHYSEGDDISDSFINDIKGIAEISDSLVYIVGNDGIERAVPVYGGRTAAYTMSWRNRFDDMHAWGMLVSIDVHECEEASLRNPDAVTAALSDLCGELGLPGIASADVTAFDDPEKGGGLNFCLILDNASQVSGNVSFASKCAYVNVFSIRFFEPRFAAELALKAFRGRRYRMQVAERR